MTSIANIVKVNIDRQTKVVTSAGFGIPMYLGLHKGFTERSRSYADITAVGDDFATTSDVYIAANEIFSQPQTVESLIIGRQDSTVATLTPAVANSTVYNVTINGVLFTYTSDADATATEIVAALIALINADVVVSPVITASGSTTLILTPAVSTTPFTVLASTNMAVVCTASETLTAAANALADYDATWYGLFSYVRDRADVLELAAWTEAAKRLYGTSSSLAAMLTAAASDTTSVAQAVSAAGYERTFVLYSAQGGDSSADVDHRFPEASWMGYMFALAPGAATWKFKSLSGITADNLTSTESTNVLAKNANTYESVAGVSITSNGTTGSGEFIDVIRDIDWLTARISERVFGRFVNLPKVWYTEHGLAIIEAELRAQLQQAIDAGVLADDTPFTITMPKISTISSADRAARTLTNVKFTARLAGAVHNTVIDGTITV